MTESVSEMQAALQLADCNFSQWGSELSLKKETKVMHVDKCCTKTAHFKGDELSKHMCSSI